MKLVLKICNASENLPSSNASQVNSISALVFAEI